ncbi:hypothetical protein CSC94_00130 [Zhengella mangrovi]|uniref:LPS-assembly lipoprotein n=1 Tax=Zhengella mangrovi TaxID=1982044 RepID=A0A2G1QSE0_9HYPH|nr:LPS assembly lipoprotein LptE [Zhengella mangrovi]PHP68456.1 hypothetical protein CSC94_00130 [Zhengella mangrovi]
MSSSDLRPLRVAPFALAAVLAVAGGLVGGCTVEPLYGSGNRLETGSVEPESSRLASISVAAPDTREALEVRNHLIFMLNGGAQRQDDARYHLRLVVTKRNMPVLDYQISANSNDLDPTAGTMELKAAYTLSDAKTGKTVATGQRMAQASYDRPRQYYSSWRAERDAVDRAARELAEYLRLALAQDLRRVEN